MRLVFDLEANGLDDTANTIWCICAKDVDTGKTFSVRWDREENIIRGWVPSVLGKATELIGHNIIGYDLPLLKKILGWEPNKNTKITDTLVLSCLGSPDRKKPEGYSGKGGAHSLECWGYRVGIQKPDHEDWSVFSEEMFVRCKEDVEINCITYSMVYEETKDFPEAIRIESEIARIISEQERHGIKFDSERARYYVSELSEQIRKIDKEVVPKLPKTLVRIGSVPINHPFLKTGGYRKQTQDYLDEAYERSLHGTLVGGPFTRIRFDSFSIGSTEQIKSYLLSHGWMPETWNYSKKSGERTSPKLEGGFNGVDGEVPRRVKERITLRHRKSQIEGWLDRLRDDGRLSAGAISNGTNTGRMRHINVVNVPKANSIKETGELIWDTSKQKDFYGTQMRSLFVAPEGFKLVGHDACGLELRMLAHYMNDKEFTEAILYGDIHEYNRTKAGLSTRDESKTFIYAFLYEAGDERIGSIVGGDARDGAAIKRDFLNSLPKLKQLIERVKRASGKGYLKGLDGRKVILRKDADGKIMRRKALNALLQSSGSILMKQSCIMLWDEVRKTDIKAYKVLDMHDEGQAEVWVPDIERYSDIARQSIVSAGEYFNLRIPMKADVKVGNNWAETH